MVFYYKLPAPISDETIERVARRLYESFYEMKSLQSLLQRARELGEDLEKERNEELTRARKGLHETSWLFNQGFVPYSDDYLDELFESRHAWENKGVFAVAEDKLGEIGIDVFEYAKKQSFYGLKRDIAKNFILTSLVMIPWAADSARYNAVGIRKLKQVMYHVIDNAFKVTRTKEKLLHEFYEERGIPHTSEKAIENSSSRGEFGLLVTSACEIFPRQWHGDSEYVEGFFDSVRAFGECFRYLAGIVSDKKVLKEAYGALDEENLRRIKDKRRVFPTIQILTEYGKYVEDGNEPAGIRHHTPISFFRKVKKLARKLEKIETPKSLELSSQTKLVDS